MGDTQANSKRLAKNTLILYVRMVFTMVVALFASRIILNALGVEDYGTYNAVAGFISMFSIISNSLTSAISRYLTFELGHGDLGRLKETFSASLIMELGIIGVVVLFGESVGLWFLNAKMVIPEGREFAANVVYQFSIITFILNLFIVPYRASIVSHEHLNIYAFTGIGRSVLVLLISYVVDWANGDKLILYSFLLLLISLLEQFFFYFYCKRHFQECHLQKIKDRGIFKNIFSFAGWNFFGAGSGVVRDQGVNVLINVFCGPVINAARGIAMQVSSAVSQFASNFMTALKPQITKSYAAGELDSSITLTMRGARFAYYLLLIPSIPLIFEAPIVLKIWLDLVPDHTVLFVQLVLAYVMFESISFTPTTLLLATGDIKKYQILVGTCQMLNLPICWIMLYFGVMPELTILCNIIVAAGCLVIRIYMLHSMLGLSIKDFIFDIVLRLIIVTTLSIVVPLICVNLFPQSILRLFVTTIASVVVSSIVILAIGMTRGERIAILNQIKKFIHK